MVSTRSSAPTLLAKASLLGAPLAYVGVLARRDETGLEATIVGLTDGTPERKVRLEEVGPLSRAMGVDGTAVLGTVLARAGADEICVFGCAGAGAGVEGTTVVGRSVTGAGSTAEVNGFGSSVLSVAGGLNALVLDGDRFSTDRITPGPVESSEASSIAGLEDVPALKGKLKSGGATPPDPLGLYSDATDWPTELSFSANPSPPASVPTGDEAPVADVSSKRGASCAVTIAATNPPTTTRTIEPLNRRDIFSAL